MAGKTVVAQQRPYIPGEINSPGFLSAENKALGRDSQRRHQSKTKIANKHDQHHAVSERGKLPTQSARANPKPSAGQAAKLANDTVDDFAVDVSQAVCALKTVSELLVIDPHQL